ncbi:MAG: RdgB/HAM1 family non-canonical purine NTP pyrophosphatase [Peptoniphilaceae bacterium]|nr:RdgB/HAM1 family non-canonical purine NTP pyrophosphatase [Peptoniphilaceae bacterium]MDY6019563.1 RdgB/HAM1 family non-canonical purine NTP pyrophosphatase [Anaerococcus sp.]
MKVVLATSNKDKIKEIKNLIPKNYQILTTKDLNIDNFEVEEDGETLKENAYKKAKALYDRIKEPVIADDTGIFVKSLDNRPGVRAHRYASNNPTYKENRNKMLEELRGKEDRSAYFCTCVCYIDKAGKDHYFEGKIYGQITEKELGAYDFGYDQIFKPESSDKTFGQMTVDEKNHYSHRALALNKFVNYLKENDEDIDN